MDYYAEFVMKLLVEELERLNDDALMILPTIFQGLIKYNLFVERLTISVLRTINYIDLTERGLTYSYAVIEAIVEVIEVIEAEDKRKGEQKGGGIRRLIFIKTLRLLTSIIPFE